MFIEGNEEWEEKEEEILKKPFHWMYGNFHSSENSYKSFSICFLELSRTSKEACLRCNITNNLEVQLWRFKLFVEFHFGGTAFCNILTYLKCYKWC